MMKTIVQCLMIMGGLVCPGGGAQPDASPLSQGVPKSPYERYRQSLEEVIRKTKEGAHALPFMLEVEESIEPVLLDRMGGEVSGMHSVAIYGSPKFPDFRFIVYSKVVKNEEGKEDLIVVSIETEERSKEDGKKWKKVGFKWQNGKIIQLAPGKK